MTDAKAQMQFKNIIEENKKKVQKEGVCMSHVDNNTYTLQISVPNDFTNSQIELLRKLSGADLTVTKEKISFSAVPYRAGESAEKIIKDVEAVCEAVKRSDI